MGEILSTAALPEAKGYGEQLSMFEDFCLDTRNYVVQSNALINAKQRLGLNATKIVRCAIMQIKPDDEVFKPYKVSIKELAGMLGMKTANNLYRDIRKIAKEIIENPVYIKQTVNGKTDFVMIPWVTKCEFRSEAGLMLKLNEELKPLLLQLKKNYTQYELSIPMSFNSPYSIRLYEMLLSRIYTNGIPRNGCQIKMTPEEIKEACGCEDKYPTFASFKSRIIDEAVKDINNGYFELSYTFEKKGKKVVAILFYINTSINRCLKKRELRQGVSSAVS